MKQDVLLQMTDICKEFPGVKALDHVSLTVKAGTVHALMGENGAGKSTLMKCLFGIYDKDSGKIELEGKEINFKNSKEALENGVAMVHQELNQALKRNVMDNLWLGRYPKVGGVMVNEKKIYDDTKKVFEELKIDVDPKRIMSTMPVSQRQMVEIAKAVSVNAKVIVFDEPTSSLTEQEVEHLFDIIEMLKKRGCGIIYISHKMAEIKRISDEITIMRDGTWVATEKADDLEMDDIIRLMVGRELTNQFPPKTNKPGDVALEVEHLSGMYSILNDVSFKARKGEILGIAGLDGSGRTETLETIFGIATRKSGTIKLDGKQVSNKNAQDSIKNGFALLTEERRATGIFGILNIRENTVISSLKRHKKGFYLSEKSMKEDTQKYIDALRTETPSQETKIRALSGGNQQKVILGRWLLTDPEVLLLDEPLAALDLKLRKEMQYELKRIQQEVGITFIFVTHDQEEALTMSDKIVVMQKGEILQIGTPQEIYNEPTNRFVANFIGESNIISGRMIEDYKVRFDDITFDCVDHGFKENEPVDVVIRPEDIDIVDVKDGKMTGEVLSVLFKGVHYEIMVETVPGTSVTVNMRVIRNHDVTSEDGSEKISANNFYVDVEDVENLDDKEIVALSNAQAWETETDEYISIANIEYELEAKEGQYPVTFSTSNGTSIERTIFVVNQPFVKNEKANEGVMAFNFFKTVDEITESQALDTDLKTWANAQGWKLTDEDQSVDISVDYDFDPEEVTEGVYEITFSTTGREFKIHTTDYSEEGQEVGLTFFPEDIHVMPKVVF